MALSMPRHWIAERGHGRCSQDPLQAVGLYNGDILWRYNGDILWWYNGDVHGDIPNISQYIIWVCLKMEYSPQNGHWTIGNMIDHQILSYPISDKPNLSLSSLHVFCFRSWCVGWGINLPSTALFGSSGRDWACATDRCWYVWSFDRFGSCFPYTKTAHVPTSRPFVCSTAGTTPLAVFPEQLPKRLRHWRRT